MFGNGYFAVRFNDGNGDFVTSAHNYQTESNSAKLGDIGDINNDGKPDVIVPHRTLRSLRIYLNDGTGFFVTPAMFRNLEFRPGQIVVADVNGDKHRDLFMRNDDDGGFAIMLNEGGGIFADPVMYPFGGESPS